MRKLLTLLSLLTLTLQFRAQEVWCEGTSWETHYDNGTVETFTLSGTTVINNTTYMNLVSNASGLVGYIRAEQDDKLVYARGIVDEQVLEECLLYDFSKSFEYGDVFRYGVLQDGIPAVIETSMERGAAKIVWYEDVLSEGTSLPAWDNILYKVGWLGNPMELFYHAGENTSAHQAPSRPKPNTTNVSHIVFRPGGGKGKMLRTVRYEVKGPSEEMKDFAFRLYDAMLKRSEEPNLVMSPLSAQIALSMLMNGANGETLQQIRSALGVADYTDDEVNSYNMQLVESMLALQEEKDVRLETINGLWTQMGCPFEQTFFQDIKNYYDAEPENVNFASQESVDHINAWAKEKSHGLIEKILEQPNEYILFMLANSLYFKGRWPQYFEPDYTHKRDFHNSDGSTTQVDMMYASEIYARAMVTENYSAVELAYGDVKNYGRNTNFGMLIFLPNNSGDELKMTKELFDQTIANLEEQKVCVYMPRFKVDLKSDLDSVFVDMGMKDMYDASEADLSKMTPVKPCFVKSSKQYLSFSVDENGTEAAGITAILGGGFGGGPRSFYIDRPFQFVLYDKVHNVPLFIGQVNNMEKAKNEKPLDDGSTEGFYCEFDKESKEAKVISPGCGKLYKGNLVIPDTIHSMGEAYAVTKIGKEAFAGCKITSVAFPKTLREIGGDAFMSSSIKSFSFPEGVTILGDVSFTGCESLEEVELPDNLTRIQDYAFAFCRRLTEITLPSTVQEIGRTAFYLCSSLESIVLSKSLEKIGEKVFEGCRKLSSIYIIGERMPEVIYNSIDYNYRYRITLYVPEKMIPEYKASGLWGGFMAILPLPDEYNGIEQLTPSPSLVKKDIYDLSGRRLEQKPTKGIYIQDRKVLSK